MSLMPYEPNTLLPSPADKLIIQLQAEVERLRKLERGILDWRYERPADFSYAPKAVKDYRRGV